MAMDNERNDMLDPENTGRAAEEDNPEFDDGQTESRDAGEVSRDASFAQRISSPEISRLRLAGMYRDWFLDYASSVILDRAVPHLEDGLKPVQRRILHSMKRMDDGRMNKVASIIGETMKFHPHGDQSIGASLVELGQKELLIDMQGNWGNILTGDDAAAPRYIEARLSKFALEVVFNAKTTEWMKSYDGRNDEPITLPVKFPLLLAQGTEGIAVGLNTKILPHNFNELLDASIHYLKDEPFELMPDFPTGGLADCSRYAEGQRGGKVKIRARIAKTDRKTLTITEIPFTKTTGKIIESIREANDAGKIRIKRVEDNTAAQVEIIVHLLPEASPDKTIDALYAFTACEVSLSPNACVISEEKPHFMSVNDILKISTDRTKDLLRQELAIRLKELEDAWHAASLERIFIENRLYLNIEECETWEDVISTIDSSLTPWKHLLHREVVYDDIVKLTEIKIKRISKYNSYKAEEQIRSFEQEMGLVRHNLEHLVAYAISYFEGIKKSYGKRFPRRTELTSFESIEATRVVAATKKLYVDRANGFIGTDSKLGEFVCDCSDIDDALVILRSGEYTITAIAEKKFVGEEIIHVGVYKRNNERTCYNVIYIDGVSGITYVKRCAITSVIRDRVYNLTQGTAGSSVLYLSVNPNGEAEVVECKLSDKYRLKRGNTFPFDFASVGIRGRGTRGNVLTKYKLQEIWCKEEGGSTLGGLKVWIDLDINRLNTEGRGKYLGEFLPNERILAVYSDGKYETLETNESTRFQGDPLVVEKFDPSKVFSIVYYDGEKNFYYMKRCPLEITSLPTTLIGDDQHSRLVDISGEADARLFVQYGKNHAYKGVDTLNADEFIGVKSFRAKGKRITTYDVDKLYFSKEGTAEEEQ